VSTQYLIPIKCISRLFGCMSLGFIARGYGLEAPSVRLSRASLLALLADLVLVFGTCILSLFGAWLLGWSKYDCIWLAKFSPLSFLMSLEGKSQVGITPIGVSSEGRMMPCRTIFSRLPTSACASGMHPVYLVGSL